MLAAWTEILPLFVVRWLAVRLCERMPMQREGHTRIVACSRPGVYIVVPPQPGDSGRDATPAQAGKWE